MRKNATKFICINGSYFLKKNCSSCGVEKMVRTEYLKKWSGLCRSCFTSNQMKGNHHTKGHKLSDEHKKKLSISGKGKQSGEKHPLFGKHQSEETKKKISDGVKKSFTPEVRSKMSISSKNRPKISEETRKKRSESVKKFFTPEFRIKMADSRRGEKSHLWKGGVTPINKAIRHSVEYRLWRESVFKRDGYTCIWCGKMGGRIEADHIKSFKDFPELRFAIDNGRTLCKECHKKTDTYGRKINK
jgi:hypothetical protein